MTNKQQNNIQLVIDYIGSLPEEQYKQNKYDGNYGADAAPCGCIVFHGIGQFGGGWSYQEFLSRIFGIINPLDRDKLWSAIPFGRIWDKVNDRWVEENMPKKADAIAVLKYLKVTGKIDWTVAPNYPDINTKSTLINALDEKYRCCKRTSMWGDACPTCRALMVMIYSLPCSLPNLTPAWHILDILESLGNFPEPTCK